MQCGKCVEEDTILALSSISKSYTQKTGKIFQATFKQLCDNMLTKEKTKKGKDDHGVGSINNASWPLDVNIHDAVNQTDVTYIYIFGIYICTSRYVVSEEKKVWKDTYQT